MRQLMTKHLTKAGSTDERDRPRSDWYRARIRPGEQKLRERGRRRVLRRAADALDVGSISGARAVHLRPDMLTPTAAE